MQLLSQHSFRANVLADVCLMKDNDRHWVDVSTLGCRLGGYAETLSTYSTVDIASL